MSVIDRKMSDFSFLFYIKWKRLGMIYSGSQNNLRIHLLISE